MNKKPIKKKPFEQLTITDDYMFKAVMQNINCAKPLLEHILKKKIRDIKIIESEKTKETGYCSRGIRMDVYIEDDDNTVYDIEMQTTKKRFFGRRFRYNQSAIDVDIANKGEGVGKLKNSYIIFITTYDPFDKGWYMYPFEILCSWDINIRMDTASKWIVLNTTGMKDSEGHEISDDMKEILSYMNGAAPESEYTKMLDDAVNEVKRNENRRTEYMYINVHDADMKEIGEYSKVVSQVRNNKRNLADDVLTDVLEISPRTLTNIRTVINAHPDWDDEQMAEEVLDLEDVPVVM